MTNYLNMIGAVVLPFLAIPLGLLAVVTTTIATMTLLLRLSFIYADLGLAMLHSWSSSAFGSKQSDKTEVVLPHLDPKTPAHLRLLPDGGRGFSTFRELSIDSNAARTPLPTSESFTSLLGSAGPNRDFEGVGGWRLTDDGQDESTKMNSRLQLPAATPPVRRRLHKRSLTSQSQRVSQSPESQRMSPAVGRNKTPPAVADPQQLDGYFDARGQAVPISPEEIATKTRMDERRLSVSSSNASSFSDLKTFSAGLTQWPTT